MNDERLFDRLSTHAGPAAVADDFEDRLYSMLQREMRRGRWSWPAASRTFRVGLVLVALLALVVIGAVVVGALLHKPIPSGPVTNGWVAYSQRGGLGGANAAADIFVIREGTEPRLLINSNSGPVSRVCPSFSPDGTRLAFAEATKDRWLDRAWARRAIVVVNIDSRGWPPGNSVRIDIPVERGEQIDPCPEWSPDGDRVAFLTGDAGDYMKLGIATADGGLTMVPRWDRRRPVRCGTACSISDIAWSPNGAAIAAAKPLDGVWLVPSEGGEPTLLAATRPIGTSAQITQVAWSPDGSRIAVTTEYAGGSAIRIVPVDGQGEAVELKDGYRPAWSPDGGRIAYVRMPWTEGAEIVVADGNGRVLHVVPAVPIPNSARTYSPEGVTWSPDGTRLLFAGWPGPALLSVSADGESAPVFYSWGVSEPSSTITPDDLSWQAVVTSDQD